MNASEERAVPALEPWLEAGFDLDAAAVWSTIEPPGRFTPAIARAWADEGFGPADAALWSDEFDDAVIARKHRNGRRISPFPIPICG